jgi:hypothetical protein
VKTVTAATEISQVAIRRAPRATYRQLAMRGLTPAEAGNLTAYLNGIGPVGSGWTVGQIERLLFLRHLARSGRLPA